MPGPSLPAPPPRPLYIVIFRPLAHSEDLFSMKTTNPDVFVKLGSRSIIKRFYNDVSAPDFQADWMAHFGTMPEQCVWIWNELNPCRTMGKSAHPRHLLWALYFLRVYPTEKMGRSAVAESTGHVDEKTWRKWTQIFVKAISFLESRVVSHVL